ncbi:serine/threonine-protein kinase [uncultured Adlercreutzia sp.]|uniref:serine/threonine-protein kinase n=1 Tax=uncultured Adlercreutzia sp. TaxID=875803 RepID=UPI002676C18B|nr:serine/threonine-protein kinase [uncultured Adlercreutzia sp.]
MAPMKLILNRYRVIDRAGAGGYGTVVHAFDTHLKRDVAIKCIELSEDEVARARLVALEARMAADLEGAGEDAPVAAADRGTGIAAGGAGRGSAAGSAPATPAGGFPADPDFLRGVDERRGRGSSPSQRAASADEIPPWEDEGAGVVDLDGSLIPWDAGTAGFGGAAPRRGLEGRVGPRKTRHAPEAPSAPAVEVQDAAPMSDYFDESAVDVRHLRPVRASRTIDGGSERQRRRKGGATVRAEAARSAVASVSAPAPGASADFDEPDDADLFEHIPGLEEARSVAKLSDANIVTVYDCAVEDGRAYVIMEYIEGKTLAQIIDEIDDSITLDVVAAVFSAVAHALEVAHGENTLHLDIKPENVIVNSKGVAKVTDFGLAALMDASGSGTTGGGTIGYMPLEQMRQEPLDVRTDEWALASLTYEMLSGENPFFADDLREAEEAIEDAELVLPSLCWDELPAEADDVMFAALDPDKDERFETVAEFSEALMPLLGNAKKGKKVLADIVKGKEDAVAAPEPALPVDPLPPLVDRLGLRGLTVLGHGVAAVAVGLMAAVACANIHLNAGSSFGLLTDSPVAFWVVVALAAAVAAVRPSVGSLFGYGGLVVALGAHGDWALALFLAAVTGVWWYFVGRRGTTQAVAALAQPLFGSFGFAGVAPVLSGVLLPVIQSAISAAFAFVTALVMASFGSLDVMNWDAVFHLQLSGNPQAACLSMLAQSGTWVIGISWVLSAAVYSLFCVRGTKAFDMAGSVACAVILMLGVCAAAHLTAFGGSWLPEPAALLGALVPGVLGIAAAAMNAPDRARWAEEEWYLDEGELAA